MAQQAVDVTVNPGVDITVNSDKVKVKKGVDTVKWKSTKGGQTFSIVLPDGEPSISSGWDGNKWYCTAGPFDGSARTVKYDVTADGTPTLDPDVEVIP